ncbi:MAG: acetoacetate decarboxylase family protein [Bacteroidota bacterium]|nr:acetoacetate decarboxylase family protein [Bacteroidota bacterium]
MSHKPDLVAPAPWTLTGDGLVFLYAIPKTVNQQFGFLEEYQKQTYWGWVGAVMLMNYSNSPVGPYQELLFIPGVLKVNGKFTFTVSKIYVSTLASAWNGRENWGIPKELADFSLQMNEDGTLAYEVKKEGKIFFTACAKPFGMRLPVTTKLFPWARIVQQLRNQFLLTKIKATGHAQFASTRTIHAVTNFFPPVQQLKQLATVYLNDFWLVFPVPEVITL